MCFDEGVNNLYTHKILLLLPHVHIIGHNTDNTDAEPVRHNLNLVRIQMVSCVIKHVLAYTVSLVIVAVLLLILKTVVEVVVSQCVIVVSAVVHDVCENLRALRHMIRKV